MFKVQGHAKDAMYVYLGVWPHDDAIDFAKKARLQVNPVNGIAELLLSEPEPFHAAVAADQGGGGVPAAEPIMRKLGHSVDALVDDLGLDRALAELAVEVVDPDDLVTLANEAVSWQGAALI